MTVFKDYFYGNKISDYGLENGYVDYRTFAKAFDAVLANDLMSKTADIGYWEPVTSDIYFEDLDGTIYTQEERDDRIEELEAHLEDETDPDEIQEIEAQIEALNEEHYKDIFQWYIVDENGARICEEFGEVLYYNEVLDLYLWGVDHYGTAWDYVLTNIKCDPNA